MARAGVLIQGWLIGEVAALGQRIELDLGKMVQGSSSGTLDERSVTFFTEITQTRQNSATSGYLSPNGL